jgi:hypothetical protein
MRNFKWHSFIELVLIKVTMQLGTASRLTCGSQATPEDYKTVATLRTADRK